MIDEDILFFFKDDMEALPLYQAFEARVLAEVENVHIKVQSSQISFYNRHMFACVSFLKVRRKKDRSNHYIVVTFGLGSRLDSARVDVVTEPYPGRWTHHVMISDEREIDDELVSWVRDAAAFSQSK